MLKVKTLIFTTAPTVATLVPAAAASWRRVGEDGRVTDLQGDARAASPPTTKEEGVMDRKMGRLVLLALVAGLMAILAAPAGAASDRLSGVSVYDTTGACPEPPVGYEDFVSYPPLVMTGSLEGCWYTKLISAKDNGIPSGVYQERGEEVFVGRLDGGPVGTFATTYKFTSKWNPDVSTGSEVRGRCEHPIVVGSGTGGFEGAAGRVDFKDIVATGEYIYRGHIRLG